MNEPSSQADPSSILGEGSSHREASQRALVAAREAPDAGVCLFTVGGRQFALDTSAVGEVIAVDNMLPVPLSPAPVLGLFNLRGTPVAIIDLLSVLGAAAVGTTSESYSLLVLRTEQTVAALRVDRLDAVFPAGRGKRALQEGGGHPAAIGFYEPDNDARSAVLLGAPLLIQSLLKLGFQDNDERRSLT